MAGNRGLAAQVRQLREAVQARETVLVGGYEKEPISEERWGALERYVLGRAAEQIAAEVAAHPGREPEQAAVAAVPGSTAWTLEHTRHSHWAGAIERGWIDPATKRYIGPGVNSLAEQAAS